MARQTAIVCVAALGMTMIIVSGGIDLSVGSIVALSTVVTAVLLRQGAGPLRWPRSVPSPPARVCGAINGLLITRLRVVPFIVTLGTMLLVRGAAKGLADERRVEAPITWLNDLLRTAQDGRGLAPALGHLDDRGAGASSSAFTLRYTRFGRHLFAIGSNERTARLCGVRINRTQAGRLHAGRGAGRRWRESSSSRSCRSAIRPSRSGLELDVIAAVIIGGGSLLGGRGQRRRHDRGRRHHGGDPDRLLPAGAAELGAADRHRRIIVFAVGLDRWRQTTSGMRR